MFEGSFCLVADWFGMSLAVVSSVLWPLLHSQRTAAWAVSLVVVVPGVVPAR